MCPTKYFSSCFDIRVKIICSIIISIATYRPEVALISHLIPDTYRPCYYQCKNASRIADSCKRLHRIYLSVFFICQRELTPTSHLVIVTAFRNSKCWYLEFSRCIICFCWRADVSRWLLLRKQKSISVASVCLSVVHLHSISYCHWSYRVTWEVLHCWGFLFSFIIGTAHGILIYVLVGCVCLCWYLTYSLL